MSESELLFQYILYTLVSCFLRTLDLLTHDDCEIALARTDNGKKNTKSNGAK